MPGSTRSRLVNERAVARVRRDWARLPPGDAPAGIAIDGHPFAADLDVFGRASLFQWVGPAATAVGAQRLAGWLLVPAPRDEVEARQEAVGALAPLDEWREHLAAHGVRSSGARQAEVEQFLAWAEGGAFLGGRSALLRVAVLAHHRRDLGAASRCSLPESPTARSG